MSRAIAELAYDDVGESTFGDTVANVVDFDFSGLEWEINDVSTISTGTWRVKKGGMADAGDAEIEVLYSGTEWAALKALGGVRKAWRVKLNLDDDQETTGDAFTFTGIVSNVGGSFALEPESTFPVTIAISGNVTHSPGS